jgi:hypothetical protein
MKKLHFELYVPAADQPFVVRAIRTDISAFFGAVMINPVGRLLLTVFLLAPVSTFAADRTNVQFCWAMGKFDHTIYFAEVENREDRQASFDTLLEISGIDHDAVNCATSDITAHRVERARLMKDWRDSEFEVVNTTFMSDLDY